MQQTGERKLRVTSGGREKTEMSSAGQSQSEQGGRKGHEERKKQSTAV